ncbi:MAG: hypothetical protein ACP5U0_07495 [Caldisphaera sp.]
MEIKFLHTALDLIEGTVAGGLVGLGFDIIANAVSVLPNSFLAVSPNIVAPLSVVAGALAFIGYSLPKIRNEIAE